MAPMVGGSSREGLEQSCGDDWVTTSRPGEGVELLRAWFGGQAFTRHRHDTYAIGVTEAGVQTFDYRGRIERSVPGQVVVLHPDEMHDGRAGTDLGFGYRIVYVDPARIAAAVRAITGRPTPLPFVPEPVSHNPTLARAVTAAFRCSPEPLALDALVLRLAEGLLEGSTRDRALRTPRRFDRAALERARALLGARRAVVRSTELETSRGTGPLRARAAVPRLVWHEPLPLLADAAARLRPEPARRRHVAGRVGAGGGLCRPGALHAHVSLGLRADTGALCQAAQADRSPSGQRTARATEPFRLS